MTTFPFVSKAECPWILITRKSGIQYDIPDSVLLLELEATSMIGEEDLYREFARVLRFPDYFGYNYDALNECLNDLEWLPANGYLLIIKKAEYLLREEPDKALEVFLSILNRAGSVWATPITGGNPWDRPERPFHTVLELDKEDALKKYISVLEKINIDFQVL